MYLKSFLKCMTAGAVSLFLVQVAMAAQCGNNSAGYPGWLAQFKAEAAANGIGKRGLAALDGTRYAQKTINADRNQKSFRYSLDKFMQVRGAATIAKRGRGLKQKHARLFANLERQYGVPAGPLLAIWGMETGFGSYMGKQNTISAIVTLAYDCRRPDFFKPHAIAALKLVDSGALTASSVGAMHGEIGHTQFLPGNVLKYGVGNRNLRDRETALISTANFLRAHGWKPGASYEANMGAIAGWNAARVYQQAIAIMAREIDK
jgi:membrane-bound lytic murein transglycosylase B